MTTCGQCGAGLRPGDRFCTQCAAPVPQRPARSPLPAVLAVLAVVAVLAGVSWYVLGADPGADPAPLAVPGTSSPPEADPEPADAGLPTVDLTPQPPAPPVDRPDPTEELAAQAAADRPAAEALVGSWVPQISSKADGTEANGVVYDATRILAEFREAQLRHGAILVRSDDYSTFRRPGYWVVLVPQRFTAPQAANSWCVTSGFGPDDCFAKRLSHTDGPEGNTLPWGR